MCYCLFTFNLIEIMSSHSKIFSACDNSLTFLNLDNSSLIIKNLVQTLYLIKSSFWTPQIVPHVPILETFFMVFPHYPKIKCLNQPFRSSLESY